MISFTNQDPDLYLFVPEYTEEELQVLEEERLRLTEQLGAEGRLGASMDW